MHRRPRTVLCTRRPFRHGNSRTGPRFLLIAASGTPPPVRLPDATREMCAGRTCEKKDGAADCGNGYGPPRVRGSGGIDEATMAGGTATRMLTGHDPGRRLCTAPAREGPPPFERNPSSIAARPHSRREESGGCACGPEHSGRQQGGSQPIHARAAGGEVSRSHAASSIAATGNRGRGGTPLRDAPVRKHTSRRRPGRAGKRRCRWKPPALRRVQWQCEQPAAMLLPAERRLTRSSERRIERAHPVCWRG